MENKNRKNIPIFFAADENYLPCLAVTVKSIELHSSPDYMYDIKVLTDGFSDDGCAALRRLETENVRISVVDVNEVIARSRSLLKLRLRDYYSEAIFYRLYIPMLFPKLERAIYIDCDIVLNDDIAKLYFTDIGDNILGVIADESIPKVPPFVDYVRAWVGVEPEEYFNSGVLLMNLKAFRSEKIYEKFFEILNEHNFETVAPDQDYLNYLCHGRVTYLPGGWNKQPDPSNAPAEEELHLIHYNFYMKPWLYEGVYYDEKFWAVADLTQFGEPLRARRAAYTEEEKRIDKEGGDKLVGGAAVLASTEGGFLATLGTAGSYSLKG